MVKGVPRKEANVLQSDHGDMALANGRRKDVRPIRTAVQRPKHRLYHDITRPVNTLMPNVCDRTYAFQHVHVRRRRDHAPGHARVADLGGLDPQPVTYTALAIGVPEGVVTGQAVRHIIRVQESDPRRVGQASATKHLDVRPGDQEDRCATVLCCGDSADGFVTTSGHNRVGGEERREVLRDTDGSAVW